MFAMYFLQVNSINELESHFSLVAVFILQIISISIHSARSLLYAFQFHFLFLLQINHRKHCIHCARSVCLFVCSSIAMGSWLCLCARKANHNSTDKFPFSNVLCVVLPFYFVQCSYFHQLDFFFHSDSIHSMPCHSGPFRSRSDFDDFSSLSLSLLHTLLRSSHFNHNGHWKEEEKKCDLRLHYCPIVNTSNSKRFNAKQTATVYQLYETIRNKYYKFYNLNKTKRTNNTIPNSMEQKGRHWNEEERKKKKKKISFCCWIVYGRSWSTISVWDDERYDDLLSVAFHSVVLRFCPFRYLCRSVQKKKRKNWKPNNLQYSRIVIKLKIVIQWFIFLFSLRIQGFLQFLWFTSWQSQKYFKFSKLTQFYIMKLFSISKFVRPTIQNELIKCFSDLLW